MGECEGGATGHPDSLGGRKNWVCLQKDRLLPVMRRIGIKGVIVNKLKTGEIGSNNSKKPL